MYQFLLAHAAAQHVALHSTSYQGFWQFMAAQFDQLGLRHGCELAINGNEHGPNRWLWVQHLTGRTSPCYVLNHQTPFLPNPDA